MPQDSIPQMLALAIRHHHARQWPQAEALCRQILHQQPDHVEALHLLGHTLRVTGRLTEAIDALARVVALQPGHGSAHANLAAAWQARGDANKAIEAYANVLALRPDSVPVLNNLGVLLQAAGRHPEAEQCYQRVLALDPDNADAWCNLGSLRCAQGQAEAGIDACRKAIALRPDHAQAHYNLSLALSGRQGPDEALNSCRQAIRLKPDFADAHTQLGNIHKEQGRLDEAIDCYRRAMAMAPRNVLAHSNLLLAMLHHPATDAPSLLREQQQWEQQHARPLYAHIRPHDNVRLPDRPLRIGYVSPDLRRHVVGWLMEALLANHDHRQFHITCYSDAPRPDAHSTLLKSHVDLWRDTHALGDEQLAERIRQDQIDILVDLALHTAGNRLLVFARKPAPVQVTYLGYPGSTGLSAMDYRLTDACLSPRQGEPPATPQPAPADGPENLVYLPQTYYCYTPSATIPAASELPADSTGRITFASFNRIIKVNDQVIALWSDLLKALPGSRLLMLIPGGESNGQIRPAFQRRSLPPDRLILLPRQKTTEQYFSLYHQADIALDTFPYGGHVTTLDSLYMGVPVVTLAGQRAVGRAGISILSNVGLSGLVAQTPEEYLRLALELANDLPRLRELRHTLRGRMQSSPLMDGPRFARCVESACREMWRTWCQS